MLISAEFRVRAANAEGFGAYGTTPSRGDSTSSASSEEEEAERRAFLEKLTNEKHKQRRIWLYAIVLMVVCFFLAFIVVFMIGKILH